MTKIVTGDIITTTNAQYIEMGQTIAFYSSDGVYRDLAKVTAKKGSVLSIRPLKWYERLWVRVKTLWNRLKNKYTEWIAVIEG